MLQATANNSVIGIRVTQIEFIIKKSDTAFQPQKVLVSLDKLLFDPPVWFVFQFDFTW